MNLLKKTQNLLFLFILLFVFSGCLGADTKNGFDISNATIPKNEILSGGPSKDGIPSIDNPKFVDIKDVYYLKDEDIIIGVQMGETIRGYPTRILIWHEIVNDKIDDKYFAVTYCPLCGTAMVFDRDIKGQIREFGVSGLLYQSDVLMYDRQTDSLWSQLGLESVSGESAGEKLKWLPSLHMTYKSFKEKYPKAKMLSLETGHIRNYSANAYGSYFKSEDTMFPVNIRRYELNKKEMVVGLIINGKAKAYPIKVLKKENYVKDKVGREFITIEYDHNKRLIVVKDNDNKQIASVLVYWFAWQAFYPDTLLYE